VHYDTLDEVHLAIRVPSGKVAGANPEARIVDASDVVFDQWPLPIDPDGWVTEDFTNLEMGFQYGIFFPGLNLYK
jgi:hypothetical protein